MADEHKHAFPVQPPEGSLAAPGPCRVCGKTWARAEAERQLKEVQAVLATLDERGQ
jgi:hypothetical protein